MPVWPPERSHSFVCPNETPMQAFDLHAPPAGIKVSFVPVKRPPLSVVSYSRWHELELLAADWERLRAASPGAGVFMSWDYLATWWRCFGDRYQLRIAVARDERDHVVGIAPFVIGRGQTRARQVLRQLCLLGCAREPVSQFMDILTAPERRQDVARELIASLFQNGPGSWDIIYQPLIKPGSVFAAALLSFATERDIPIRIHERDEAPFALLPTSWEAFFSSRSRNWRSKMRNVENRVTARNDVEVLIAGETISLEPALDALIELHRQRWGAKTLAFSDARSEAFTREVARRLLAQNRLLLMLVRIGGEWVAGNLAFIEGGRIYHIQSGRRPDLAELSLGSFVLAQQCKWGIARGYSAFDFLCGEGEYKQRWKSGARDAISLECVNPRSARGSLFWSLRGLWASCHALRDKHAAAAMTGEPA